MWRKGILVQHWWDCKLVQSQWNTLYEGWAKKIKIGQPYDPAISLLGTYLKQTKTPIQKDTCTLMFTAALFTIAKIWKQPKCSPIDEWIKKIRYKYIFYIYIYAHNGLLTVIFKINFKILFFSF